MSSAMGVGALVSAIELTLFALANGIAVSVD